MYGTRSSFGAFIVVVNVKLHGHNIMAASWNEFAILLSSFKKTTKVLKSYINKRWIHTNIPC